MIYENIVRLCMENGISIHKLERTLGFGNGVICKWKDSSPRADALKKVSDFFGVTVDSLLDGNGNSREASGYVSFLNGDSVAGIAFSGHEELFAILRSRIQEARVRVTVRFTDGDGANG